MISAIDPRNISVYGQTEDQETNLMTVFGWLLTEDDHSHLVLGPDVLLIEQFKLRNSLGPLAMTTEEALQ
jgi:hypothetical protein